MDRDGEIMDVLVERKNFEFLFACGTSNLMVIIGEGLEGRYFLLETLDLELCVLQLFIQITILILQIVWCLSLNLEVVFKSG